MEELKIDIDLPSEREIKKKQKKIKVITRIVSIALAVICAVLIVVSMVVQANEKIEIVNSSIDYEYKQHFGYSTIISGTLKNDTRKDYKCVDITFFVYEEYGNYLGEASVEIKDVEAREVCDFKTTLFISTSKILPYYAQAKPATYKLMEIETW